MTTATCSQRDVFLLLDGELSEVPRTAVREHISNCQPCRALYDSLLPAVEALHSMPAPELTPLDVARLHRRILVPQTIAGPERVELHGAIPLAQPIAEVKAQHAQPQFTPDWRLWIPTAAAAVAMVAFIVGISYFKLPVADSGITLPAHGIDAAQSPAAGADSGVPVQLGAPTAAIAQSGGRDVTVDRLLPSGTRIIWVYQSGA